MISVFGRYVREETPFSACVRLMPFITYSNFWNDVCRMTNGVCSLGKFCSALEVRRLEAAGPEQWKG